LGRCLSAESAGAEVWPVHRVSKFTIWLSFTDFPQASKPCPIQTDPSPTGFAGVPKQGAVSLSPGPLAASVRCRTDPAASSPAGRRCLLGKALRFCIRVIVGSATLQPCVQSSRPRRRERRLVADHGLAAHRQHRDRVEWLGTGIGQRHRRVRRYGNRAAGRCARSLAARRVSPRA